MNLTIQYDDEIEEASVEIVDPELLLNFDLKPWFMAVMLTASYDFMMGHATKYEVSPIFYSREMGVVVYRDRVVGAIVTVYVEE